MNCFFCKGSFTESVINHVVNYKDSIIIIKNVPCMACVQCGESFYSDEVAVKLEKIVAAINATHIAEVAIVNFSDKVA